MIGAFRRSFAFVRIPVIAVAMTALAAGCGGRASIPPAPSAVAAPPSPFAFRDVAGAMGVRFQAGITDRSPLDISELMGGGVGFLDYDGDGRPDLVLVGPQGAALYRNLGDRFEDVTAPSGLGGLGKGLQGIASADYDGDGRPDLLVTTLNGVRLLRNAGGRFVDMTNSAGLTVTGWCTSAAFADGDGDGLLDLYIGRYVAFGPKSPRFGSSNGLQLTLGPVAYEAVPGVYYRNIGGGRFVDATDASGLRSSHGKTLGVIFADYDGDGDQDLYLANDQALSDCFENDGKGHFRSVGIENGTAASVAGLPMSGMGVDWADLWGDGRYSLFVTTLFGEPKSLFERTGSGASGVFADRSTARGLGVGALRWTGFGAAFADWDNDGHPDLMVANGHIVDQMPKLNAEIGYPQPTQVLANDGARFRDVSAGAGEAFGRRIVGRGLAVADFDGDGRLDAAVANLNGPPLLLRNESKAGNWVGLRLLGHPPNRDGIGARIVLDAGGRRQGALVMSGRSYMSALPPTCHFGIGSAESATAEVAWPDGKRQAVSGLKAGTVNEIREP